MLNLNGIVENKERIRMEEYSSMRLSQEAQSKLLTAEALVLYEQNYMDKAKIKELCEEVYKVELEEPMTSYIPDRIADAFRDSKAVPVCYMPMQKKIIAAIIPEFAEEFRPVHIEGFSIGYVGVPLYYYIERYIDIFGPCPLLKDISPKMVFQMITDEAIDLGASDITISTKGKRAAVYYNVRKKKVDSKRIFDYTFVDGIIRLVTVENAYDKTRRTPHYVSWTLNKDYRARIVINKTFKGYSMTARVLPNVAFSANLDELNLGLVTRAWLRETLINQYTGLRVIVGSTCSGKNTTALACLHELIGKENLKVVSIEMPVEQELPGVEQIDTANVNEYNKCIHSLIHQNPDFVYVTEIKDEVAKSILEQANTGKRVLSTLHANSVAEAIPRLSELTGLSYDRVIMSLHSIVYQELIRDEEHDKLYPKCRYVEFSPADKRYMYGKSLGEILNYVGSKEGGDVWSQYTVRTDA